jgi:hypothetical protein
VWWTRFIGQPTEAPAGGKPRTKAEATLRINFTGRTGGAAQP